LPVEIRFCIFLKAPVSHPHFPHSTGLSTKPTGRHYTKNTGSPRTLAEPPRDGLREGYLGDMGRGAKGYGLGRILAD